MPTNDSIGARVYTENNAEHAESGSKFENLDKLIKDITIKEYELKSAILSDNDDEIEKLDGEISSLLNGILNHNCPSRSEKKMLLTYLFDRYLCDNEIKSFIPSGVMDKMRSLF